MAQLAPKVSKVSKDQQETLDQLETLVRKVILDQ